jgi:hypothetical protein
VTPSRAAAGNGLPTQPHAGGQRQRRLRRVSLPCPRVEQRQLRRESLRRRAQRCRAATTFYNMTLKRVWRWWGRAQLSRWPDTTTKNAVPDLLMGGGWDRATSGRGWREFKICDFGSGEGDEGGCHRGGVSSTRVTKLLAPRYHKLLMGGRVSDRYLL